MSDSVRPQRWQPTRLPVPGILQARTLSGLPFPSPGDLPDPGIEPRSPARQADSLPSEVQVKVVQLSPTLCDPMGYTLHGILQARILEWVAFPFSRGSFQPRIEPRSPELQADS